MFIVKVCLQEITTRIDLPMVTKVKKEQKEKGKKFTQSLFKLLTYHQRQHIDIFCCIILYSYGV